MTMLQFYVIICTFFISCSPVYWWNQFFFVFHFIYVQRIDMNDIIGELLRESDVESSSSDQTRLDSASPPKKRTNQKRGWPVCFTCGSQGHASWLWLVVFDPYFFEAEKPLSENLYFIPNLVVWFLKVGRGRKASSLEGLIDLCYICHQIS